MEKEEQIFRKRIQELAETAFRRDIPVHTDFLNLNEQTIFQMVSGALPPVRYELTGGFEMAERKVVCFLPSYEEVLYEPPFDCLKISPANRRFAEELGHRDYLGAIMNLGIERAVIGDIVIKEQEAFVFVLKNMSSYVRDSLTSIRRTSVIVTLCEDAGELLKPELEAICGTVSSVRLDAIVALAGRLSRTKAAACIEGEKVFVNGQTVTNVSRILKEGEILTILCIGKFRFANVGGPTKKGRISVTLEQYK